MVKEALMAAGSRCRVSLMTCYRVCHGCHAVEEIDAVLSGIDAVMIILYLMAVRACCTVRLLQEMQPSVQGSTVQEGRSRAVRA